MCEEQSIIQGYCGAVTARSASKVGASHNAGPEIAWRAAILDNCFHFIKTKDMET